MNLIVINEKFFVLKKRDDVHEKEVYAIYVILLYQDNHPHLNLKPEKRFLTKQFFDFQ